MGHGVITGLDLNTKSAQVESFAIVGDNQQHSSEIREEKDMFGCPLWSDNKPNEQVFRDFGFTLEPKNTFILNHADHIIKVQCLFGTIHAARLTVSYYDKVVLQRLIWYAHELQNGVYYITGKDLSFSPAKTQLYKI